MPQGVGIWISRTWTRQSPEIMLRKQYFYKEKQRFHVKVLWCLYLIQKYARRWSQSTIFEMMLRNLNKSCSKKSVFYKENWRFRILRHYDSSNNDTKICTALRPEHDFREDDPKPEKCMLRKPYLLQGKSKILWFLEILMVCVAVIFCNSYTFWDRGGVTTTKAQRWGSCSRLSKNAICRRKMTP